MRVLFVNYRYYLSGGPERYLFRAKELLEQHGHGGTSGVSCGLLWFHLCG